MGYVVSFYMKVFQPKSFHCVGAVIPGDTDLVISFMGVRYRVRPGTNDLDLLLHHESRTLDWFQPKAGDVVVDVGAHIGRYALQAAALNCRVVAVEPDPMNYATLQENVSLNGFRNIRLYQVALSDQPGQRALRMASGTNRGTSSLEIDSNAVANEPGPAEIKVVCETLDALTMREGIERIDWLKIDVEGHELAVLRGAPRSLETTLRLILEVRNDHEEPCRRILEKAGFELRDVESGYPASNWFLWRRSPST